MIEHGRLAGYKAGCKCLPCRCANADYEARRRRQAGTAQGRAIEARRRVRQLEREGYTKARIALLCGWTDGRAYHVTFRPGQVIRRSTLAKIRRVARFAMLEGVD